jgi:hypothetical protein
MIRKAAGPRGRPRSFDPIEARERRPRTRQLIWVTTFDSAAGVLPQDTALKGAAEEKSTPETLTTACHAASWLARS